MNKKFFIFFFVLATVVTYAQVGIGTNAPNAHAVLDLRSPGNNQGMLVPALTTVQRTAAAFVSSLGATDIGLLVFDTNDKTFYFWTGTQWDNVQHGTPAGTGTVTSVGSGTGLTGGPITGSGSLALANTAVVAGTYGSATQVGQFVVDAQGRITFAGNSTIAGVPPGGVAGGDLTGTFPNPGVAKIQGNGVASTAPALNQVLKWNGSNWAPAADANAGGTLTSVATGTGLAGGPITTSGTISLANTTVAPATYGDVTHVPQLTVDAQGRITSASNIVIPSGTVNSVVTGTGLTGGPITTSGTVSLANTAVAPATYGDVTHVPQLTVDAQGRITSASNIVIPSGTVNSVATGIGLTGGPITTSGTVSLANTAVTPATYGDGTHVSQLTVDAQGRVTLAANVTITGAPPTGTAGGDLTGTYPNPTIATGSVTSTKILDGTIATADLANGGVTDVKIAAGVTPSKISASATNGDVLTTVAGATAWATPASGTVTSVATGTGLTGGPVTTSGTISLANTAVTAGSYGSATQVAQIIVDAQGRLTNVKNTAITATLALPYTNTVVSNLQAFSITNNGTAATSQGIAGYSNISDGVYGAGGNSGVQGAHSSGNYGLIGTASWGVYGNGTYGVYGENKGGNYGYWGNTAYGGYGEAATNTSIGVYGTNTTTKYPSYGYLGAANYGVYGTNQVIGVYGRNSNTGEYGQLGGGGYGVYSGGQAGGTTTWVATSDIRFKKNVATLTGSLEKVLQLRGVSYDWRTDEFPDKHFTHSRDIGVIAQEVRGLLPEVVFQDKQGYYSVSYEKMVPVLIEAIKQQQVRIVAGQDELSELKMRIAALEKLLLPAAAGPNTEAVTGRRN